MSMEEVIPAVWSSHINVRPALDPEYTLEDFFENSTVCLHIVGGDGTILRANKAELQMLGYTASEYIGRHIKEFHADEDTIDDILARLTRGEKLDKFPARLRTRDGRVRDVEITSSAQFCNGKFVNTRCFTTDITESKRADELIAEQNQRLAATYEHAEIGISEIDAQGIRLTANKAACAITGHSREEMIGGTPFSLLAPGEDDRDREQHDAMVAGRIDRYTAQNRYLRPDGSLIWLDVTCTAVRDPTGRFLYSVRVFRDITAARQASDALTESRQRLAATYEHAGVGISEVDAEGRLLHVNESTCTITGYSRDELLKLSIFDVTHPDDRKTDIDKFRLQVDHNEQSQTVEKRLIRKDGAIIWVAVTSSVIRDAAGKFLYGIRVMQDITERRQATEQLRESENRYRQLIEALPAAVYTTDAEGRITFYNQAAVELSGRKPIIGSDQWCVTWKLYRPDGTLLPLDQCPMAISLKEGRPVRGQEAVAERPDGTRVPFIPYPTPLRDAYGTVVGAVNMLADISERKQSEANQQVLLDELNHRVKNNMQMLHSLVRAARRETENADARAVLADAADRIGAMAAAQRVLYEAGATLDFNARPFLEAVCSSTRTLLKDLTVEIGECTADRLSNDTAMPLSLMAHELIINAAKHGTPAGKNGSVRLSLTRGTDSYSLVVEDDGPGFTLDQVRRRSSGLGLVQGLARQLSGTFRVEKNGRGARCVVEFKRGGVQIKSGA